MVRPQRRISYETRQLGVENIETGEMFDYPKVEREFYSHELNAAGASLTMNPFISVDRTLLFPDPKHLDKAVHLGRRGSITWFHMCSDKIIEFARRRATKKRAGGSPGTSGFATRPARLSAN